MTDKDPDSPYEITRKVFTGGAFFVVSADVLRELINITNPADISPAAQQLIREVNQ